MSEVDDVKLQPTVPIPMALDAEPVPVAIVADTWCCSSCESLCAGVPCFSSLFAIAHEAWDKLIYFVKWVFGYTAFQQVDRFYDTWSVKHIPGRNHAEFAAVKAEWIADIRALPEAPQHAIFCAFQARHNEDIVWPANLSAEGEPFNAEEREAMLNAMYPGDPEILADLRKNVDLAYIADRTDHQRIGFLHALWPQELGDETPHLVRARWKQNLELISENAFRFAATAYANKNHTIFHGYTDVPRFEPDKPLEEIQLQVVRYNVGKRPGERTFMDALLQYQQQGT